MKALITGAGGQLGRALLASVPGNAEAVGRTSTELDIADSGAVEAEVAALAPDVIINAAAYTAVDRAESDAERAQAVNVAGVANLAWAAQACHCRLIHVSTDFVFGGDRSTPLDPDATSAPASVYGQTKRDGELAALAYSRSLIVRTSWLYSRDGNNFVLTMLRLMSEREELGVVADQIGTPTWTCDLASALWVLAQTEECGILHYSDSGVASWYDFAVAIQEEALLLGLLERAVPIVPIATSGYPTAACRPAYSVLNTQRTAEILGANPPHWRTSLRKMLKEIQVNG